MGVKYDDWIKMRDKLEETDDLLSVFIEDCAKELAARLLAKVIKRTPVGDYAGAGTLRRGWTGGKTSNAASYANSLKVHHFGGNYVIEIVNPTEYASYVEFGHRTRNHKGWVKGVFMLTISEQEIDQAAPAILEKKIKKYLGDCFK